MPTPRGARRRPHGTGDAPTEQRQAGAVARLEAENAALQAESAKLRQRLEELERQLASRRAGPPQASGRGVRQVDSRRSRRRCIDRLGNPRTRLAAGRLRRGAKLGRFDDPRQVAVVSETRYEFERRLGMLADKFRARQIRPRAVGAS